MEDKPYTTLEKIQEQKDSIKNKPLKKHITRGVTYESSHGGEYYLKNAKPTDPSKWKIHKLIGMISIPIVISLFALLFMGILNLTGCVDINNTNYLNKYKHYLSDSLGDYSVLEDQKVHFNTSPIPAYVTGRVWQLEFYGKDNKKYYFTFYNTGYTDGGNDDNFGYAVLDYARGFGSLEINDKIARKYFPLKQDNELQEDTSIWTGCEMPLKFDDYSKCIKNNGIMLREITAKELAHKWGCTFNLFVETNISDEEKLKEIIERSKEVTKETACYLDVSSLIMNINGVDMDHSYIITYNRETDTFTEETRAEELFRYQHPDGHVRSLFPYFINGEEIDYLEPVQYIEKSKQYRISGSYLDKILLALGLEVSDVDGEYSAISWELDGNTFVYDYIDGGSLQMNNSPNLLKYNINDEKGITIEDFEMMSGSKVRIDEEKGCVYIDSN